MAFNEMWYLVDCERENSLLNSVGFRLGFGVRVKVCAPAGKDIWRNRGMHSI